MQQMIRSGQGDRVLAIWSQVAPKEEPRANGGSSSGNDSPLASALGRMPGADGAPVAHLPGAVAGDDGASACDAGQWAADSQSAGVAGEGPAGQDRQDNGPRIGEVLLPGQLVLGVDAAPGRAGAPTPPQPPAREVIHPHGSNFDFSVEDECWSGDEDPDERASSGDAAVVVGIARTGAAA
ncbi:MAG TPA: hypothetical protein VHN38_01365 [Immundisolibacter sp.]|nr:hypothetical protein [Immundisolibacter sp.]